MMSNPVRIEQQSEHSLVECVEEEDERDDGVCGRVRSVDCVLSRADSLEGEEEKHSSCRGEEEDTTTNTVDQEGREDSPEQVPDSEDT